MKSLPYYIHDDKYLVGLLPGMEPGPWMRTPRWMLWLKPWRRRAYGRATLEVEWQYATHSDFLLL
jgi:hypothetical protein